MIFSSLAALAAHPACYYRFESLTDATIDSAGGFNLTIPASATAHAQVQQKDARSVGNFAVFGYGLEAKAGWPAKPSRVWGAHACGGIIPPTASGLTIEFLLHPTPQCFMRGGFSHLLGSTTDRVGFEITMFGLEFVAKAAGDGAGDGVLTVPLTGEGTLASDYLWSTTAPAGQWHHIALVRDAHKGTQAIWIDGERQPAMLNASARASAAGIGDVGELLLDAGSSTALCAGIDEVAVYPTALSDSLIYAHSQDALVRRQPYSTTDPGGAVPQTVYPNASNASFFDAAEFTPGTVLPSPGSHFHPGGGGNNTACDDCLSCLDQLTFAPDPQYDAAAAAKYKLKYNFNWMDPYHYMAGDWPRTREHFNISKAIVELLASRWRYGLQLTRTAADANATIAMANAQPDVPLHAVIPGERGALANHSLPKGCYMQNANGQFITILGDVIPAGEPPTLRPMSAATAAAQNCPDSIFAKDDGDAVRAQFAPLAAAGLRRPIDVLNSDGEVFIGLMSHRTPPAPAEYWNYSLDAVSAADYAASGAPNWETFFSQWRVRLTTNWKKEIMAPLEADVFKGARFSMYEVMGDNPYFGNWSVTRAIGDPWPDAAAGGKPTYYSTFDFYLQHPAQWWPGAGPDHGIGWAQTVRRSERALGDELFSPFVAAGWWGQEEYNLRPAQWLGLLKVLGVWGAEFFYTGFFSLRQPFQNPQNWCWQAMMPSYAQALLSVAAPFVFEGSLVLNDENTTFAMDDDGTQASPLLWAGAPNVVALARAHAGAFLIVCTAQRLSNAKGNLAANGGKGRPGFASRLVLPAAAAAAAGAPPTVELFCRPQGSVYVYAKNATTGDFGLTQIDEWHGAGHPLAW